MSMTCRIAVPISATRAYCLINAVLVITNSAKRARSPLGGNASDTKCCSHFDLFEPRFNPTSGLTHSRNYSIDGLTRVVGSYVVNLLQSDLNEAGPRGGRCAVHQDLSKYFVA
jgi:hypothetical protein